MSNLAHLCRRQCGTDNDGAGYSANEGEEEQEEERLPTMALNSVPTMALSLWKRLYEYFNFFVVCFVLFYFLGQGFSV